MKKIKTLLLLTLSLLSLTLLRAEKPIKVNYEYMLLDMCNSKTAAYLKFYQDTLSESTIRITRIDISTLNQIIQTTRVQIENNETELFDLTPSNNTLEFEVKIYDSTGRITTKIVRINTKDDSMVNVTDRLYKYIDEYTKTKSSLYTFWCGKKVSKVELFAFFQKFLKLTPQQICDMVSRYNQVVGSNFTSTAVANDTWLQNMCALFTEFHNNFNPGGSPTGDCLCKLIRTKDSALNVQGEPDFNESDDCMNYRADVDAVNFDAKPEDNDLIFSQGRIGAAKAGRMHMFYDGVDSSPNNFKTSLHQGWSTIRYRLVFVDPATISPNLENCKACNKQIETEYGYYSKTFLTAQTYSCVLCQQSAWISIEDWAMMFVNKNGVLQDTIIHGEKKFTAKCDVPEDDPTIDGALTSANTLVDAISTAIGSATTANIFAAATSAVAFYNSTFAESLCGELNLDDYTLFHGQKSYEIAPGDELKFTLVSNATFGGKVVNHGEAIAQINSDFYLATVLTTIPNGEGEVQAYCECEKIGAYTLGSLDASTEDLPPVDEPNNTSESNWSVVFDDPPFGVATMKLLTGSFIGSFGPWPGAFETTNCCDVKIKCMSDCVALIGCGPNPDVTKIRNKQINISEMSLLNDIIRDSIGLNTRNESILLSRTDNNSIKIFPNPLTANELNIVLNEDTKIYSIKIYDLKGTKILEHPLMDSFEYLHLSVTLPDLVKGMYVVLLTDRNGNNFWNKIIKQ